MKYYIDDLGRYIGGSDSVVLSEHEVLTAPDNAVKIWDGVSWVLPASSLEENRIADIKAEADRRIIGLDSSWTTVNYEQKQRNDLMMGAGVLLSISKALNSGIQQILTQQLQQVM